jgi:hypothetical protein
VPHLQLVGSALATLLAYTALWIALLVQSNKVLPISSAPRVLPLSLLAACAVAVGAAALPVGGAMMILRLAVALLALAWLLRIVQSIRSGAGAESDVARMPTAPEMVH